MNHLLARFMAAAPIVAALAGCAVPNVLVTPGSAHIEQITGDYQKVAACAYRRLSARKGNGLSWKPGIRRNVIEIASTANEKVEWRLELRHAGRRLTEVMVPLPRVVGATPPEELLPDVRACATR